MIICPWCGTNYITFQSNCQKCGGPLLPPAEQHPSGANSSTLKPPPAPRTIDNKFVGSLMLTDGWAIAAGIFSLLGGIFTLVGLFLTIIIVTAFVGIPFAIIGIIFLAFGLPVLASRHGMAKKTLAVLKYGEPTDGKILDMKINMMVRVGLQHPTIITYSFQLNGQDYQGSVATLNQPKLEVGQPVCVLYLPQNPEYNALFPHP